MNFEARMGIAIINIIQHTIRQTLVPYTASDIGNVRISSNDSMANGWISEINV